MRRGTAVTFGKMRAETGGIQDRGKHTDEPRGQTQTNTREKREVASRVLGDAPAVRSRYMTLQSSLRAPFLWRQVDASGCRWASAQGAGGSSPCDYCTVVQGRVSPIPVLTQLTSSTTVSPSPSPHSSFQHQSSVWHSPAIVSFLLHSNCLVQVGFPRSVILLPNLSWSPSLSRDSVFFNIRTASC